MCQSVEDRLNRYIYSYFENCSEQELQEIEVASRTICRALDSSETFFQRNFPPET